jgi:hypothetical protein
VSTNVCERLGSTDGTAVGGLFNAIDGLDDSSVMVGAPVGLLVQNRAACTSSLAFFNSASKVMKIFLAAVHLSSFCIFVPSDAHIFFR